MSLEPRRSTLRSKHENTSRLDETKEQYRGRLVDERLMETHIVRVYRVFVIDWMSGSKILTGSTNIFKSEGFILLERKRRGTFFFHPLFIKTPRPKKERGVLGSCVVMMHNHDDFLTHFVSSLHSGASLPLQKSAITRVCQDDFFPILLSASASPRQRLVDLWHRIR